MLLLMKAPMTPTDSFREAIAAAGLTPPDDIIGDGKIHRFSSSGKPRDNAGRYIFHDDDRPAGWFKCMREGIEATWTSKQEREFTAEEKAEWRRRMDAARAQRDAEAAVLRDEAAKKAASMWAAASDATERGHPYTARKQVSGIGARVMRDMLLIPLRHGPGALVGLQIIQPDGGKKFLTGTPKAGAYTVLGKPARTGPVIICEGWATGASIHMATGWCVVVAFDAGNLEAVAKKIRAALPEAAITIAADDDAWTEGNPGVSAANQAARAIGGTVAEPRWAGDRVEKHTDFNDLHADEGLDAVRACFDDPREPDPEPGRDEPNNGVLHKGGVLAASSNPGPAASGPDPTGTGAPQRTPAPPSPERVKPASDPVPERGANNAGSDAGGTPFPSGVAVHDEPHPPVILPGGGSDVQILPAISDQLAPECSDDDIAAQHLQRMQGNTLWCEMWGRWMVWNGDRWLRDETNMVLDVVRQSCRLVANNVLGNPELDPGKRQRQADKIASYRTISNVERLARTYRAVATHPDEWDRDLWALNTPGGVVNLRTGASRPHAPEDRFTKMTAVAPGGACPTWLQFLQRATGGDDKLIAFLKRMCGYALTGEVREHALFFVYGTGGNGKGTFLNTITHIMGDYQRVSGAETFTESPGDRHTTELARLQGARLVTAQETEEGKRWAESRIKALTGGDPITARFMRQDDFTFLPQFKLVIVGNHKPAFRSVDDAIKRRLHLIPFTTVIPAAEKDPLLADKLRAEAAGILAWMIEGCLEWERDGLMPPQIVKESTAEYLGAEDSLQQWIDECCDIGPGFESSKALFYSWTKWCELSGEYVGTMKRLMAKLESRGILTGQKMRHVRGCQGIKIKRDDEEYENNPY